MIYAGLINFNDSPDRVQDLRSALEFYTRTPTIVIEKSSLTLVYGKLSTTQDVDEIWENEYSVVMGRLFDKREKCSFGKKDFKNFASLSKEEIFERIWGKYVYIHTDEKAAQFDIVVDSTGQLPFFYTTFPNGNILFASDIEIIFKVLKQKPEINWTYLCSYLVYSNSSSIQTPFQNIYELPPTCCLKITRNDRTTKPFWNPLRSYKALPSEEKDAVSVLEETLKPWIEPYRNICVSLSGGLDSSSLVYSLKNIKKEDQVLSALNYFHGQVESSNELIHARKVCEETGIDLIEIDISDSLPFDPSSFHSPLNLNKPFPGLMSLKSLATISSHLPNAGPCTFLSGHGSDHIFMQPPSKNSLSDYILEKGFKGSNSQLNNITQFYRDPIFSVLKENIISLGAYCFSQRFGKRHPKNIQDKQPSWINKILLQKASSDFVHPIYEALSKKILPGKYDQIDALYEGLASIHMQVDKINPTAYPFLCEPVVDFALSFPTFELFDKGYDRYPLRQSVSNRFKTETVWRRDKSQTTGIMQLGVKKNLKDVLGLCLEGHFVKQGLVDKEGLRETIKLIGSGDINHLWPFFHLASAEIFLKNWDEKIL